MPNICVLRRSLLIIMVMAGSTLSGHAFAQTPEQANAAFAAAGLASTLHQSTARTSTHVTAELDATVGAMLTHAATEADRLALDLLAEANSESLAEMRNRYFRLRELRERIELLGPGALEGRFTDPEWAALIEQWSDLNAYFRAAR